VNEVAITDYTVRGSQNYDKMTIVEAALATSAASTFFPPLEVDGRKYIDGALGSNNPINVIWNSAHAIWSPEQDLTPNVLSVVSIGTSKGAFAAVQSNAYKFLTETLTRIVTETEQTHRMFENGHPAMIPRQGLRQYYRQVFFSSNCCIISTARISLTKAISTGGMWIKGWKRLGWKSTRKSI